MADFDCFSTNDEDFIDGNKWGAIDQLDGDGELEVGRSYQLGVSAKPKPSSYFNFDRLIEDMQEAAYDDCGENAENYLADLPDEKCAELKTMIETWLDANVTPTFYKVKQVQSFQVTQDDIDEFRNSD